MNQSIVQRKRENRYLLLFVTIEHILTFDIILIICQ